MEGKARERKETDRIRKELNGIKMEVNLNGYRMDMERMKSRESKLAASNSVQGDCKKHFSGLVGLDHFIGEEREGMEELETQQRKEHRKKWKQHWKRKWIGKELGRNTRNEKNEMEWTWSTLGKE